MSQPLGPLTPADFSMPAILLAGNVDYEMYERFRDQLSAAPASGLIVVELSTLGGDPEVARMMARTSASTAISKPIAASFSWARPPSIRPAQPS